ncbi:hypothetical protein [Aureimonas sp. AU12]|uniref:hypothetical protein n=1 Tax=Aureimonas sp. AU12 TaxID=1638161 RepID=UPI000780AB26|nr:hypothetical protein [Aureimonas sp. AU12]
MAALRLSAGLGLTSRTALSSVLPPVASTAARLPLDTPLVLLGNSKNADLFAYSMMGYVVGVTGGRYYTGPWARQAKGGDWVMDYVQRLPACIAAAPGGVLWVGDATNDIGKKWPSGTQTARSPALILADYRTIAERWFQAGGRRLLVELTARLAGMTAGSASDLDRQAVNAGLAAMAREAAFTGRMALADLTVLDLANAALSRDGTHYTARGAFAAAQIVGGVLADWIVGDPAVPANGVTPASPGFGPNINDNATLADVAPANGIPDGYIVQGASGATMSTTLTSRAGRPALRFAFTGAATGTGNDRIYRTFTAPGGAPAGTSWEMILDYDLANAAGTGDPAGLSGIGGKAATGTQFGEAVQPAAGVLPRHRGTVRIASPPIAVSSGQSAVSTVNGEFAMRGAVGVEQDAALEILGPVVFRQCETQAYAAPFHQGQTYVQPSGGASALIYSTPAASRSGTMLNVSPGNVSGGAIAIAYQWRRDGQPISGATNRFFESGGAIGSYDCVLRFDNAMGTLSLTSSPVAIT